MAAELGRISIPVEVEAYAIVEGERVLLGRGLTGIELPLSTELVQVSFKNEEADHVACRSV